MENEGKAYKQMKQKWVKAYTCKENYVADNGTVRIFELKKKKIDCEWKKYGFFEKS